MAKEVPGPWIRRPLSIGLVIVFGLLAPIATPIGMLIAAPVDLITRTKGMRRTRTVALFGSLFLIDFIGQVLVSLLWLISPVGLRVEHPTRQRRYANMMRLWTWALQKALSRLLPFRLDTSELDESLLAGNAIVIGRHRSLVDAIVPAVVFGSRDLTVLYTLKEDLRWDPNIDIVGHRMGHVFVNRSPADLDAELEPIRKLGRRIDENTVGVIFPEGTFFNEKRRARALRSLEKRDPEHVELARKMHYLLPPRPAGTLAMFDGAPDADVIMLGHVGYETFGSVKQILANIGGDHSVVLRAWRFARNTIPTDPSAQIDWLFERWVEMDEWIASHHPLGSDETSHPLHASPGGS